ncbi:MAG: DUF805 domain-containing protein [Flavobacteriaceae bacterium]
MNYYLKVLKQYADFNGRARRKEYWIYNIINSIIGGLLFFLDYLLGTTIDFLDLGEGNSLGILYLVYALFVFIPGVAVAVRRLHDVGKSGWMLLIALIPVIGAIWLLVLYLTDSNPGENKYGPNPKEA